MIAGDLILTLASGYAANGCYHCGMQYMNCRIGTYGICFTHGLLGLINYFAEVDAANKAYEFTLSVVDIVPLPFMATQLYLEHSMDKTLAYIHAVSGILPIVTDLMDNNSTNIRDLVIIGNVASVTFLGIQHDQPWYIALAVMGAINHFYTRKMSEGLDLPTTQGISVGLAIFCLISALKVHRM